MRCFLIPLLYLASLFSVALSFSVTVGSPPTQCGSLSVSWTGGQAPFEIMLTPAFNIPRNISVPSTAFSNNHGSYQISPVPFFKGTQFLLTMSDATGFATGGTSELLTVGDPVASVSCNTTSPAIPFTFSLPSSLQQCSPYIFNGYDGAVLPVTITGFIPGGDVFVLHPPSGGTSYTWVANVAAGTTVIFVVTDALGNSGGSSDAEMVALSNTADCLINTIYPSSTVSSIPSPSAASGSPTQTHTQTSTPSGVSSGAIAGVVVGAVGAVAVIAALAAFCLKRRRYGRSQYGLAPTRDLRRPHSVELDPGMDNFQHPPIYPFPYQADSVSRLAPPIIPRPSAAPVLYQETHLADPSVNASEAPHTYQHSRTNSNIDSFATFGDNANSSMSSGGRRKAAMAGISSCQPATRFVVHTDAEDDTPKDEPEVVELPPQYSDRRTLVTHTEVSSVTSPSSTNTVYWSGQDVGEPLGATPHPPLG